MVNLRHDAALPDAEVLDIHHDKIYVVLFRVSNPLYVVTRTHVDQQPQKHFH
jgi:hypothetical protein